jgi:ParB-like chromosome segregation protein Spo0J
MDVKTDENEVVEFMLPVLQHEDIDIEAIVVADRHRKDLGDIEGLSASIKEQGLLQPVGVDKDNRLVFGERRLRAFQHLGWTRIPVRRVNVTSIVDGEYAENEVRKDFTPSERVAIAAAVASEVERRQGARTDLGQNIARSGRPDDVIATKSGFGNRETLRQAKSVVALKDDELVAAMDSGKLSISAAAKTATLPQPIRKEVVNASDPKKALREAVIAAATTAPRSTTDNRNPLYQPNDKFKAVASVTGCCDTINTKIETYGIAFLREGIVDDGMRARESATITRCITNLNELLEALNA